MKDAATDARLAALYQEMILEHYRRPKNKGALPHPDARAAVHNPLCGDELEVQLSFDRERVADARFSGRGCSISQASASMMTQQVRGKTRAEIGALARQVAAMLRGEPGAGLDETLGELRALSGVARFPLRVMCAAMPWEALARAISSWTPATDESEREEG